MFHNIIKNTNIYIQKIIWQHKSNGKQMALGNFDKNINIEYKIWIISIDQAALLSAVTLKWYVH